MSKPQNIDSVIRGRDKKFERLKKKAKGENIPDEFLKEYSYFRSLLEITHSINSPRDFNELLELVVDSAISLTKAERGFLMLYGGDVNLEFKVMRNIDKKTMDGEGFKISRTVVNHVLATRKPLFLNAIYKDKKFKISESIEVLGLRMVMCVPLRVKDHLLGLIYVDSHSETESFTNLEERIFEAFAAQTSVTIENSRLHDLSVHDMLTGLHNYGFLRSRLEAEISRALRQKKDTISFIMIDLDNFKLINDSYGHEFGNSVLVKVACFIKSSVRKYDIPARYGGDEFAILMPDTDIQGARQLAQRLQGGIADLKILVGRKALSITISIGISTFPIEKIVNSEDVIIEADHALLVAKSKGKNQIAVFGLRKDTEKHEPKLIGNSKAIDEVRKMISRFAPTDATILITGETGTGKELVTTLVYQQSVRADKPLIVVNCGAIPDNLLESELFGYEKGAFTGAYRQHKGKFELAQGGTIFLDEISEIPLHLQVKLLRAIDKKEVDRIGGESAIKVNVRVVAASNKNVEDEVKAGNFRKDLFYRLSVATVYVPPLRERPEDIDALSIYYLNQMNAMYQRKFLGFTKDAIKAMMQHQWPGNVRELIHRIERAVIMGRGQNLDENDLGLATSEFTGVKTLRESRDEAEKKSIFHTLLNNHWNMTHASKMLGIDRKTLRYLIKKHNIVKS